MSITAEQFEALMPDCTQVESEYIEMESMLHLRERRLINIARLGYPGFEETILRFWMRGLMVN